MLTIFLVNATTIIGFLFVGMCMTVYQLSIYATLNDSAFDTNNADGKCLEKTVMNILLANSMIDLVACIVSTLGFGFAIFFAMPGDPPGYQSLELRLVNICNWVIRITFLLVNIGLLGAMSAYVWGSNCKTLGRNGFFGYMQTLLIIVWVSPTFVILSSIIFVGIFELLLLIKRFIDSRK
ncbi:5 TM domain-containing transmembrane protein [Acrasis kona]|uniref:5 TM domain-containing transmembrane protein n=1 Tax=Acrasis kona TaxID=1008807 RepID=A0AAW2ZBI3_9EUKA